MSDKLYFRIVLSVSVFVFLVVLILNRQVLPKPEIVPGFVRLLPGLNALINASCSILLLTSLYFILVKKDIRTHKRLNITTFILSSVFLVSYILFHYFGNETHFPSDNPLRPLYLFILVTHIILAATVLPLVLIAFYYGLKLDIVRHKKIVRWTFPIWLYVTLTGVIVYLMISPYYQF